MACVGCVYSVDQHVRTPEELVTTLFRDADRPQLPPPVAQHKRNWASLTREVPNPTGVIEGACRHLIKDRLERTVIRWKIPGTQAMLDIHTNDDWELYQTFRITQETKRLHSHNAA